MKLKLNLLFIILLINFLFSCNKKNEDFNIYVYIERDSVYLEKQKVCKMSYALYMKVNESNEEWNRIIEKEVDSIILEYKGNKDLALPLSIFSSDSLSSTWQVTTVSLSNNLRLYKRANNNVIEFLYVKDPKDTYLKEFLSEIPECLK